MADMVEIIHWLDRERVTIIVESGPFILFGIAWIVMRQGGAAQPPTGHRNFENEPPRGGRPLAMPKVLERTP
jgi:hypothetical protein